jgi:selenocysteine lyase/cysteine desulfurase
MIYLDNAATTYPKPDSVIWRYQKQCVNMVEIRSMGHILSLAAGRIVEEARLLLAQLFHISKPEQIVFTMNTTEALNLALKGVLSRGDHVITGSMEHNSVARPLEFLKTKGVEYSKVLTSPIEGIQITDIEAAIKQNTKLIVINHISNVTGTENPLRKSADSAKSMEYYFLWMPHNPRESILSMLKL